MKADEVAERLTEHTGVEWSVGGMMRDEQVLLHVLEKDDDGHEALRLRWAVFDDYAERIDYDERDIQSRTKVWGAGPFDAFKNLVDHLGFGPADEVEGGDPDDSDTSDAPTLVLVPEDGEPIRVEPDEAPVEVDRDPYGKSGPIPHYKSGVWVIYADLGDRIEVDEGQQYYEGIKASSFDTFNLNGTTYTVETVEEVD